MSREWDESEIQTLTTMWAAGASASQVARALPADRSRSAVLGRVHRMGLPGRAASPNVQRPNAAKPPPRLVKLKIEAPVDCISADALEPMDPPITTLTLESCHCKWPYDVGAEYHYCGRAQKVNSPFCEAHHRKAYQPAKAA